MAGMGAAMMKLKELEMRESFPVGL